MSLDPISRAALAIVTGLRTALTPPRTKDDFVLTNDLTPEQPEPDPLNLAAFLRARLKEAETRARDLAPAGRPLEQGRYLSWVQTGDFIGDPSGYLIAYGVRSQRHRDHIVGHDPASVLARIEVDSRIIDEHDGREVASLGPGTRGQTFIVCRRCSVDGRQVIAPCETLRLLASPYASHPEWRRRWAPTTAP